MGFLRSWNNARGRKRQRSGIPGDVSRGGFFKRRKGRKGRAGREGWYFHRSPPPALHSPAPGAWRRSGPPTPPDHPGRAWPGPARPPHTSPTSGALPRTTRPTASGGEEVGAGPTRPSNFLQVHSHASRPFGSLLPGREGPCPPRPLPPGYIRSQRSRPRPGPEGRGRTGSRERRPTRLWPRAGRPGLDGQRGQRRRGAHGLAPLSSPHPHPPTCLPDPGDRGGGVWARSSGPSASPLPPGSAHLALKVNPSAARAPGLRQLVPSSGVRPASCACRPLPSSSGSAPPGRPALSALPAAVGAAAAPYV